MEDLKDFQDSPDDEEDTRSSHEFSSAKATDQTECHKCGKKGHFARDCWSKTSVPSYQSPFQSKLLLSFENKPEPRQTKDFEAKYHKVKAKLALLSSSASTPSSSSGKNKGLIAETYDWDDEEVSSDENEVTKVKALMALTDEERVSVGKESARNGDWTKISMKKVHTLLEMEDNDDRKSFLDYLCIDLNYVEEQRNNLLSKYRNLVQELNTCKEQLLVLKQAKLDLLTMQHVNTEILKENQNLRLELKELTSITETWLNSSNKVNQCINEQIPTQKKKILGINQLTEDTFSFGSKDPVFIKSLTDNSDMSITSSNLPKLYESEDFTLPNQDTNEVPSNESQRNTIDPLVVVSDSLAIDYDSADESSVYSTPLLLLKKLDGVEPVSGPKTIKSILKSKSTFKAETLKGITINEPSSAPARGKSSLAFKTSLAPTSKLKNVKMEDDPPLSIVMKELNELKLQISKKKSSYSRNKNAQQHHTGQGESSSRSRPSRPSIFSFLHTLIISLRRGISPRNPQHVTKNYETCGSNVYTTSDHKDIECGIFGEVGVNKFKNAIGAHYLPHSSEYVAPPSIDVVRQWFPTIVYGEEVSAKGTLRKSLLPPRWRLYQHILGGYHHQAEEETNGKGCSLQSISLPADNAQDEGRIWG
ncbi:retrovirus-related pol polyprotein from transposon TNT 1-94 [Tanacetum coccineum]